MQLEVSTLKISKNITSSEWKITWLWFNLLRWLDLNVDLFKTDMDSYLGLWTNCNNSWSRELQSQKPVAGTATRKS